MTSIGARQCIVVHGCPSDIERAMDPEQRTYDKHWIPWIRRELTARGMETVTPLMPEPWKPDYEKFKKAFEELEVTESTVLIGHSCGCAFLVRWLGETTQRIARLILVAPWKVAGSGDVLREKFYAYEIDRSIPSRVHDIVMFTSDDEEEGGKESLRIFHEALGGVVINLRGHGHYTMGDMGTSEFPELLEAVLRRSPEGYAGI